MKVQNNDDRAHINRRDSMLCDGLSKSDGKILSFLMVGQSNMCGRGDFGEVPQIVNDKCFMLRMGRWQPMSEPINVDRDILNISFHSGVGLAASFADEVSKYTGREVGLIPCADGGTAISQWQEGEVLFDHAVMMTRLALRNSELGGIIWHQGENDCKDFDERKYARDFLCFVSALRRELSAENLPFIMGELSENMSPDWGFGDNVSKFNKLLHSVKDEIPNCEVVSTEGLKLKADGMHFSSASCRELGIRYFEKYKLLTK